MGVSQPARLHLLGTQGSCGSASDGGVRAHGWLLGASLLQLRRGDGNCRSAGKLWD